MTGFPHPAPRDVPYVLKVVDVVGLLMGDDTHPAGAYVREYDPDGLDGLGTVVTTTDLDLALVFPSFGEAWATWQAESTVAPTRVDGKPNRPLTAFTVELARLADERRLRTSRMARP